MKGKKVGKCDCGGSLMKYEAEGFLPQTVKCNRCGSGESFSESAGEKEIKKVIKAISRGEW